MQSCGGGTAGDADKNVESIFAVGDVFETVEDGGALEGDVSSNDIGENLLLLWRRIALYQWWFNF